MYVYHFSRIILIIFSFNIQTDIPHNDYTYIGKVNRTQLPYNTTSAAPPRRVSVLLNFLQEGDIKAQLYCIVVCTYFLLW